jgi:hypothetical protein
MSMAEERSSRPERDDEGFVALPTLRALARELSSRAFAETCHVPVLVTSRFRETTRRSAVPSNASARRELSYRHTAISSRERSAVFARPSYAGRIAFLDKRPGNPFPQMITLGRALTNDVVFTLQSVSKFQGYFSRGDGRWTFTDQRSANGSFLNGARLEPGKAHLLADGDLLRFGLDLKTVFLLPASLHERLRRT